ncbi:BCCIP-like protein [Euroglyphus maynei]|uniref:BCCIP-like protein n=1 Tax=Euroglyphus maynei TaxID=6958 RepID=A0A1Y3B5V4_EURMA|nr:BCCIP-like protein [Euroglyphus maynei]
MNQKNKRNLDNDQHSNDKKRSKQNEESDNDKVEDPEISDDEEEEDEENDYDEDNEELSEEEISVEFTAHDPIESDFHGIRCLLQQLWLKENIDISELTELVMKDTITTVLKQSIDEDEQPDEEEQNDDNDDDDNVFGVISIIPFNSHFNDRNCVQQIKQILSSYLPKDNDIFNKLNHAKCALIINERFVNLPPKISVPCYQQLLAELTSKSSSNEKFEFDHIIMISKVSKNRNNIIYTNAEDEIFSERAEMEFEYSVAKQSDTHSIDWNDDEKTFEPFRKLLLLTKERWIETINVLKNLV